MTPEQRAMAWEQAAQCISEYALGHTYCSEKNRYIEGKIIPHLYKKAKALRRKERAKDPRNKTDMEPEL